MEHLVTAQLEDEREDAAKVCVFDAVGRDASVGKCDDIPLIREEAKRRCPREVSPVKPFGGVAVCLEAIVSGPDLDLSVGRIGQEALALTGPGEHQFRTSSWVSTPASSPCTRPRSRASSPASRSRPTPGLARRRTPQQLRFDLRPGPAVGEKLQKRAPVGLSEKIRFVFR
jgi:hypothetical protein